MLPEPPALKLLGKSVTRFAYVCVPADKGVPAMVTAEKVQFWCRMHPGVAGGKCQGAGLLTSYMGSNTAPEAPGLMTMFPKPSELTPAARKIPPSRVQVPV